MWYNAWCTITVYILFYLFSYYFLGPVFCVLSFPIVKNKIRFDFKSRCSRRESLSPPGQADLFWWPLCYHHNSSLMRCHDSAVCGSGGSPTQTDHKTWSKLVGGIKYPNASWALLMCVSHQWWEVTLNILKWTLQIVQMRLDLVFKWTWWNHSGISLLCLISCTVLKIWRCSSYLGFHEKHIM